MTLADDIRSSMDHHRDRLVGASMCVLNAGDGYPRWRQEMRIAPDRRWL